MHPHSLALFACCCLLLISAASCFEFVTPTNSTVWSSQEYHTVSWKLNPDSQTEPKLIRLYLVKPKDINTARVAYKVLSEEIHADQLEAKVYIAGDMVGDTWQLLACDTQGLEKQGRYGVYCSKGFYSDGLFKISLPASGKPYKTKFSIQPPKPVTADDAFRVEVSVVDIDDKVVIDTFDIELKIKEREDLSCIRLKGATTANTKNGYHSFGLLTIDEAVKNITIVAHAHKKIKLENGEITQDEVPVDGESIPFDVLEHKPPSAPTYLETVDVFPTRAKLRWGAPSNSEISHFEVHVNEKSCCADWVPPKYSPLYTSADLHCLCPNSQYTVSVYAVDVHGFKSKEAATVKIQTPAEGTFTFENLEQSAKGGVVVIPKGNFVLILLVASSASAIITAIVAFMFPTLVKLCQVIPKASKYSTLPTDPYSSDAVRADEDKSDDEDEEHLDKANEQTELKPMHTSSV